MNLADKLQELADDIPRRQKAAIDEVNTGSYLVDPFLLALGYNPTEPDDVQKELTADVGRRRNKADYVLKQAGIEIILVEIKPVGTNLAEWVSQLDGYFRNKENIKFAILADGIKFLFFSDFDSPNVMDKEPFLALDLQNLDESVLHVLGQFSRTTFEKINAIQAARSARDRLKVRRALKAEFEPLSNRIINFLLELIQPGEIEESRRIELTRLIKQEWQSILSLPTGDDGDGELISVISADVLEIPVFADFKGKLFEATLVLKRGWGLIHYVSFIFEGKPMTHIEAAKRAVHSVDPTSYAYKPAWTFWQFEHPETRKKLPIKRLYHNDPLHHWMFEHHQDFPD